MSFINIAQPKQRASFKQAVLNPVGQHRGIYMPEKLPKLPQELFFSKDFHAISEAILSEFIGSEISPTKLSSMIKTAFNFPIKVHSLSKSNHVLELFHGPTLAFKDFGARFLAQCLSHFNDQKITIITATSGDTGAAVAHAFHGQRNIDVVVLYPAGKISREQEQLFCTLGDNIHTIKVNGNFDQCQSLVKQAFSDDDICQKLNLNSANSINIARLLAQVCYYAALPGLISAPVDHVIVPSGNFGNVTAGIIAQKMGVPLRKLTAATNSNDTAPRFFQNKQWLPKPTVATLSNAMDVSQPNNFARILHLYKDNLDDLFAEVDAITVSEICTKSMIKFQEQAGYRVDPHTAVAIAGMNEHSEPNQHQVVVSTAHPAKFADVLEEILGKSIERPASIIEAMAKTNLSTSMDDDFDDFKDYLLALD